MNGKKHNGPALARRDFLKTGAAATAAFTILPGGAYGKQRRISANDRVNIAAVGVGGMGRANLQALSSQNIVALCDVDWNYVDTRFADIPKQLEQAQQRLAQATDDVQTPARAGADRRLAEAAAAAARRRSVTPTTARCSRSRRTSTPWWWRLPITPMRTSRSRRWISANTCTCRSRWPGRWMNAGGSRDAPPRPGCRPRWETRDIPPTMPAW